MDDCDVNRSRILAFGTGDYTDCDHVAVNVIYSHNVTALATLMRMLPSDWPSHIGHKEFANRCVVASPRSYRI